MRAQRPQPNAVFGKHLRTLRRERDISQETLAERANLGVNIIGRLERAIISPGLITILKLSAALGVSAAEMLRPFTPETIAAMKLGVALSGAIRPRSARG
ncbi:MAG TPA: helix-turn-helix transcriptional regulator [Thermoanaerobaculia bacterium]|jgi:transcriptional regulator with XRE-family HTH domain|nr:helix-turn-helix transcriptional regulator [Thermoanaerobaculia bacterium]